MWSVGELHFLLFLVWFIFQLQRLLTDTNRNRKAKWWRSTWFLFNVEFGVRSCVCTAHPQDKAHTAGIMSHYSVILQCTKQAYTKRETSGVKAWHWLAFSLSPTSQHTHTFLFLSYCTSQVCRGHHGNLVFCSKQPRCCDEVSTKVYWSTRFGARLKEKSCSVLLRLVIDMKKSLETNLMNWYSWAIQSLWVCVYGLFLACSLFQ